MSRALAARGASSRDRRAARSGRRARYARRRGRRPRRVTQEGERVAPERTLALGHFLVHSRATMPLFAEPTSGDPIKMTSGKLEVSDHPIVPFIEGDGTGP